MEIIYGHNDFKSQMLTIPLKPDFDRLDISSLVDTPFNQSHFDKIQTFFTHYDTVQASVFSGIGIISAFLIFVLPCILMKFCLPTWMPKLYSAFETLCCLCTKKYRNYKIASKQDKKEMPRITPSAPPQEPALPSPQSVLDKLIIEPSAPPMDQAGAVEFLEEYMDHKNYTLSSEELALLSNLRENWRRLRPGINSETDYPGTLQIKHFIKSKPPKKEFQPTQYIVHTLSTDDSFEEID